MKNDLAAFKTVASIVLVFIVTKLDYLVSIGFPEIVVFFILCGIAGMNIMQSFMGTDEEGEES